MLNNEAIIQAIKQGDNQNVLRSLYSQVLPEVTRFVRKNGGNSVQAEDVFQEGVVTFIMAVKEGKFKEGNSIIAYIKAVVRNKWYDQFKAKLKEEEAVKNRYEDNQIEEKKMNEDQVKTVQTLLKNLGEQCEKLIRLSVFQGHSYLDIASMIGMASEDVVKSSVYRCRKKMKATVQSTPGLLNRLEF